MSQYPTARTKPWLLPYNRRMRHLQGITIRNITKNRDTRRQCTQTIDDEGIPSTLKSPAKALALREKKLKHSSSSQELRDRPSTPTHGGSAVQEDDLRASPTRPSGARIRRRSTMDWSSFSPKARQKQLEETTAGRMADVFFTIHVENEKEPVYISELVERVIHPDFCAFDFERFGPEVTRLNKFAVKVWARFEDAATYVLLIDWSVELDALQYIGRSLASLRQPLPWNCVVFHLADGLYTSFFDAGLPIVPDPDKSSQARKSAQKTVPTSTYDALMRLSTLDVCIQDALNTRSALEYEIEIILEKHQESRAIIERVPAVEDRVSSIENAIITQRRKNEAVRKQRAFMQKNLASQRDAIHKGMENLAASRRELQDAPGSLDRPKALSAQVAGDIVGQRRRICEELAQLYPIDPIEGRALAFTICKLPLPNSEFDYGSKDAEISAALGYAAKVIYQTALYLSIPLPYPVRPQESTSSIEDPISLTSGSRIYPLFIRGAVRYRFEYGVFLLNKDIEIVSNWLGLRVLDIRQTLPNLKNALFVASAGKGELPARKAGGIRGLTRQIVLTQEESARLGSSEGVNGSITISSSSKHAVPAGEITASSKRNMKSPISKVL